MPGPDWGYTRRVSREHRTFAATLFQTVEAEEILREISNLDATHFADRRVVTIVEQLNLLPANGTRHPADPTQAVPRNSWGTEDVPRLNSSPRALAGSTRTLSSVASLREESCEDGGKQELGEQQPRPRSPASRALAKCRAWLRLWRLPRLC